jgi:PKD repeat protein
LASSSDANARRIVAYGFRNPFRITERPGSGEIWVGDVGWNTWEEINRISTPADSSADNFGWPCYEGSARQPSYDNLNLTLCEELYASPGAVVQPVFTYRHTDSIVGGEACANGQGSSTVGMAFYEGGNYPAEYDGALFFADYSRDCLWVMPAGANGLPDPTKRKNFLIPASNPVHLEIGPNGDLFYVDLNGGSIRRIEYSDGNRPPVANATANPTSGQAPLTVTFDGRASTDPDGSPLTYAWDLDGNGTFGDSSSATPSYTYTSPGTYQPRLRVTDPQGASDTSPPINVEVANTPPVATIDTPAAGTTWKVGDTIAFSGHGSDAEDGALPASALRWNVVLMHCPLDCHEHPLQTLSGVSGGSFSAPDHGLPMHLELRLTATDAFGVATTATRQLHPRTVDLALRTEPAGLTLEIAGSSSTTPFTKRLIVGSTTTLSASSPQDLAGTRYEFQSWSDGKAATHSITAGATGTTYTATFTPVGPDVQGDRSTYVPITPIRVLDTRKGIGLSGEFGVNAPRSWTVAGFDGGSIPTDAVAVTGNVTVTGQSAKGYVSLTPGPNADPKSSTINFPRGDTRANNVTIPLAADGRLSAVYKATSGSTELIFDVTGYFLEGANATYSPVTPYRRVDSRNGSGMPGGSPAKFASGVPRSFGIAGSDGIPANAVAVTGNLTAVRQSSSGFLALTPDPEPAPTTSSLNFPVGDTRANGFTAPLNGSGRLSVTFVSSSSAATTDVLVDITGYFVESDDGLAYYPMAPVRAFDTRATTNTGISGPFISRTPRGLTIAGQWGTVAGARAITGNLTVTRQQQRGHVSATPASVPDPTTSTLNFPYGDTRANGAVVPLNASGGSWFVYVSPSTGMTTHLILDVTGYFAP